MARSRKEDSQGKHKIKEANKHKLECKPEHKANNKDQDKTSDTFRHFNFKTYISQISIFRIGRSVMEALSSFEMLLYSNSL